MATSTLVTRIFCTLGLAILLAGGCTESNSPPPTITIESLPSSLEKAFAKSTPDAKKLVSEVLDQLKVPDYAVAYSKLQTLSATSNLSKQQSQITAAGLLTVHNLLLSAQSKGDTSASQTLDAYRKYK